MVSFFINLVGFVVTMTLALVHFCEFHLYKQFLDP